MHEEQPLEIRKHGDTRNEPLRMTIARASARQRPLGAWFSLSRAVDLGVWLCQRAMHVGVIETNHGAQDGRTTNSYVPTNKSGDSSHAGAGPTKGCFGVHRITKRTMQANPRKNRSQSERNTRENASSRESITRPQAQRFHGGAGPFHLLTVNVGPGFG